MSRYSHRQPRQRIRRFWWWFKRRHYRKIQIVPSIADALDVKEHEVVIVGNSEFYKWALLRCPCGCSKVLHVNLMKSHFPHWSIYVSMKRYVSFSPSLWVDESECGSHFFIRRGRVYWCTSTLSTWEHV